LIPPLSGQWSTEAKLRQSGGREHFYPTGSPRCLYDLVFCNYGILKIFFLQV